MSPIKQSLDPNINDSKSHICNSFFENIISGIQLFYISAHVTVGIIRVFFQFQIFKYKVSKPTKTSEKDHSFYKTVSFKILRTSALLTLKCLSNSLYPRQKIFVQKT